MGRFFVVCLLLSACTTSPVVRPVSLPRASATPGGETPGVVVSSVPSPVASQPSSLPGAVSTPAPVASGSSSLLPQPSVRPSSGTLPGFSHGGGSGGGGSVPQPTPTPRFYIRDVVLTDTGESVMGTNAPAAIQARYSRSNDILLTLRGNFKPDLLMSEEMMRFTYEAGLMHQSFRGDTPAAHLLLNESILIEPISINLESMTFKLNTQYLPDLYLSGLHRLTLVAGPERIQKDVRVGSPNEFILLLPQLLSVRSEQGQLWITGKHFFVTPELNQVWVNGALYPVQQINVLADGSSEAILSFAVPLADSYMITYQSPFGQTTQTFEVTP